MQMWGRSADWAAIALPIKSMVTRSVTSPGQKHTGAEVYPCIMGGIGGKVSARGGDVSELVLLLSAACCCCCLLLGLQ